MKCGTHPTPYFICHFLSPVFLLHFPCGSSHELVSFPRSVGVSVSVGQTRGGPAGGLWLPQPGPGVEAALPPAQHEQAWEVGPDGKRPSGSSLCLLG